jgi:hypothetical protein
MSVEGARFTFASPAYLILPAALLPILFRQRWLHGLALSGFALLYLILPFGQRLAG